MSKHTPGPWQTLPEECDRPYIRVRGTLLGRRYKVANVLTPTYDGVDEREAIQTRANARLIAAAPELLEVALLQEEANALFDKQGATATYMMLSSELHRKRRDAIAKATNTGGV